MSTHKFFLNRPDPSKPYVFFCNLYVEHEEEAFCVGEVDSLNGRTIAHDLFEHSNKHRVRNYVPWEEELRASGAARYVRGSLMAEDDSNYDLGYALDYLEHSDKEIQPVPYTYLSLCRENPLGVRVESFVQELGKENRTLIQSIADQMNYGYLLRYLSNYPIHEDDFLAVTGYFEYYMLEDYIKRAYFLYDSATGSIINTSNTYHFPY